MKYFHNYANRRRLSNSIWETLDASGLTVSDPDSIKKEAISYFSGPYKDQKSASIVD